MLIDLCFSILFTDWDGVWWLLTKFSRKTTSLPHFFTKDLLGSGLKPISTRRLIISGLAKTSNNGWRTAPDTISAARLKVSLKEIFPTFEKWMCGCIYMPHMSRKDTNYGHRIYLPWILKSQRHKEWEYLCSNTSHIFYFTRSIAHSRMNIWTCKINFLPWLKNFRQLNWRPVYGY